MTLLNKSNRIEMATAKKVEKEVKEVVHKKPQLVQKNYRLLKYQPLTFTLKTGRDNNLVIFDPEAQENRAIKHCPNEKTIFVDSQSKNAVVSEIVFKNGILETKEKDVLTQQFLEAHPSKGLIYEYIDEAKDAKELVDMEEVIIDIKQAIRDKAKAKNGVEELRMVVSVLNGSASAAATMSAHELKRAAYDLVDTNPNRFISDDGTVTIFDDGDITRKAAAQSAFIAGVIQVSNDARRIQWADNKQTICNIPIGKNYLDYFSEFLESEEGMTVMKELGKRS